MSIQEYIEQFRLDQENYEFSRKEFLQEFSKEFLERFKKLPRNNGIPPYYEFRDLIKTHQEKFWAISQEKSGKPFSEDLWKAFYAITVVPLRKTHYPDLQEKILSFRESKILNKQDKWEIQR